MAMKAFGILLTATVAFASPNESRRQLQEGPCADLDGDGDTDVSDLLSLLAAYGVDDSGDTDGDGDTDVTDLLNLLAAYGVSACSPSSGPPQFLGGTPPMTHLFPRPSQLCSGSPHP